MSRVCTLALPRPPCLFVFSWRCTTRPWTPVKVMLVYDRGLAPRPGLESPIGTQSPGEGSAPIGGTAVQQRDHGGAFKHINTLKMQHRYCFTHGQVLLQFVFKKNACTSAPLQLALTHINRPDSCPQVTVVTVTVIVNYSVNFTVNSTHEDIKCHLNH